MLSRFYKQLLFISLGIAILVVGGLAIYSATPSGNLKVNPILGHDLETIVQNSKCKVQS